MSESSPAVEASDRGGPIAAGVHHAANGRAARDQVVDDHGRAPLDLAGHRPAGDHALAAVLIEEGRGRLPAGARGQVDFPECRGHSDAMIGA